MSRLRPPRAPRRGGQHAGPGRAGSPYSHHVGPHRHGSSRADRPRGAERAEHAQPGHGAGDGHNDAVRHVAGKDEVLVLVADAVLEETHALHPLDGMGWRQVIAELAHAMRAALTAHPNVAPVFATAVPVGPNSLRGRD